MKTVWMALGGLGFVSGAAFVVFWLLAWTGQIPFGELVLISCGTMLLVTGLFSFRGAADKTADRGTWKRSNVKVGRLSAFGFGIAFCSIGVVFLGFNRLPEQFKIWLAGATLAGFALIWLGGTLDGRRARAEAAPEKGNHGPSGFLGKKS